MTHTNEQERMEFEAWWKSEMNIEAMDLSRTDLPWPPEKQVYKCIETERAWLTWKAARRVQVAPMTLEQAQQSMRSATSHKPGKIIAASGLCAPQPPEAEQCQSCRTGSPYACTCTFKTDRNSAPSCFETECVTCNGHGAVGGITNAEPCPDCAPPSHSMSQYASKDDMLKAVMAENEGLKAQLAAAQQGVPIGYIHPQNISRLERGEPVAVRKNGWDGEPNQMAVYATQSAKQEDSHHG